MSQLREIIVSVSGDDAEWLMEMCFDQGGISVSVFDPHENSSLEVPIFYNPDQEVSSYWKECFVKILLTDSQSELEFIKKLKLVCDFPFKLISSALVEEKNWQEDFKQHFPAKVINDTLRILPAWEKVPEDSIPNLIIDPGLAFGTGTHPTTMMCLDVLTRIDISDKTVLDWGCGSGILAIAAGLLGANQVMGLDIDPLAVQSSFKNAGQNKLSIEFFNLSDWKPQTVDLIVANILLNPVLDLYNTFLDHLNKHGTLVISGLLNHQKHEVLAVYSPGFELKKELVLEDWLCLVFDKKTDEVLT